MKTTYALISCSPVSLWLVPRDPASGVVKTARGLAAIDVAIERLTQYYSCPESERKAQNKGPYFRDPNPW